MKKIMKKILCRIKGHIRENTWYLPWEKSWRIECERCGKLYQYKSPHARLIGEEMRVGFTGD